MRVLNLVCGFAGLVAATPVAVGEGSWIVKRQGPEKEVYQPHVIEQLVCFWDAIKGCWGGFADMWAD